MRQILPIGISVVFLSGCSTTPLRTAVTSGEIGCPTTELQIRDGDMGWTTNTWTATCRGKTFYCTYTTSSLGMGARTVCKEEIARP